MTVESINLGLRQPPDDDAPRHWFSVGKSMAGDITKLDHGVTEREKTLTWLKVSTANRDSLQAALLEKEWELITIVLDSGDTLGYGATGTVTDQYYVGGSFKSSYLSPGFYTVSFNIYRVS